MMDKIGHHSFVLLVNRSMTEFLFKTLLITALGHAISLNELFHTLILMKTNDNL